MKALMLAGGSGTRLRPLSHTSSKQLVPVANKPVLFYGLETIAGAGIREMGIVVGDARAEIEAAVGDGSAYGLNVTYIHQSAPLGLAHAVLIAGDYLGDDDFIMYLGDNFIVGGIADLVERFSLRRPTAQIALTRMDDPRQFGVAQLDTDGRVIGLAEKPREPRSDLALIGVYVFTPAVHTAVAEIQPSRRGELEITDAIQRLIEVGQRVEAMMLSGYWKDIGNPSDMLEVNRLVLESLDARVDGYVDDASEPIGRVTVEPGAIVQGTTIVGPAIVGSGVRVADSYVGPFTSIGSDSFVSRSEIEDSIVLPGASISGVHRIEASLIGRSVEITSVQRTPGIHQLVLGDHSKVQISS